MITIKHTLKNIVVIPTETVRKRHYSSLLAGSGIKPEIVQIIYRPSQKSKTKLKSSNERR